MTVEEFEKMRESMTIKEGAYCPGYYLVHLRERYAHEKKWTEYNILFCFDNISAKYKWDWDFWEGQEFVEVLGFIDLDDIKVPDYDQGTKKYKPCPCCGTELHEYCFTCGYEGEKIEDVGEV